MSAPSQIQGLDPAMLATLLEQPLVLEERDDAATIVPAVPAQSFVKLARALRSEGRLELLLPHASADQVTALLDLDAWQGDRVDIAAARLWLTALGESYALASKERGELAEMLANMDPEMWSVAFAPGTVVVDLPMDDEEAVQAARAQVESLISYETPDGFFVVGAPDDAAGRMTLRAIERLYHDDMGTARRLLLSIQHILLSAAEEDLFRWRAGRLADMGFVPWEEAMKLLRPLDAAAAATRERVVGEPTDPVPDLESLELPQREGDLLRQIFAQLSPEQHGVRSREFLLLVNEVLAAQRLEPGNADHQAHAATQAHSTVELGLQLLAQHRQGTLPVLDFLAGRVEVLGMREVFRVGYGPLHALRAAATELHRRGNVSLKTPGSLLDRPWGPAIAAFLQPLPGLPLASKSDASRPLRTLKDLAEATALVQQAAGLAQLAFDPRGFALDPVWLGRADEPERLVLGDFIRTALIHRALPTTSGDLAPLTPDDLAWARANLCDNGRLKEEVREAFRDAAVGIEQPELADSIGDPLLTRLEAELLGLEFDPGGVVDLRRVGGVLTIQHVSVWLKLRVGVDAEASN